MNYANIKFTDVSNGEGVRVSLFVSGCSRGCKGCFNREAWDFAYGREFARDVENSIISACKKSFITGLSVLGGEPFEPRNQAVLAPFLQRFKAECGKSVWCYSGFSYEKDIISQNGAASCEFTAQMLENIDVLIDGEFVEELKDISLKFRGSSNQRIIELKTGRILG